MQQFYLGCIRQSCKGTSGNKGMCFVSLGKGTKAHLGDNIRKCFVGPLFHLQIVHNGNGEADVSAGQNVQVVLFEVL